MERKYDLTPKSAWYLCHRIREAMRRDLLASLLSGTVISDQTFIGGVPANRHANDPREKTRLRTDKTTVLALVDTETREVRSRVILDVTAATLSKAIAEQVDVPATDLWTDSAKPYITVGRGMRGHESVDHRAGEYVRKNAAGRHVTTNMAEGFFSQLKRSVDGTHHHVSTVHLQRYLDQFDWLYSNCKLTDSARMRILVVRAGGRRLTYKPLTSR